MSNDPRWIRRMFGLSFAAICGLCAAFVTPTKADTSFGLSIAANTKNYLGRRAIDGSFGFDGLAFHVSHREGMVEFDVAVGETFREKQAALAHLDIGVRFGAGDWKVGFGKRGRHWSPSRYSSLILSRNAQAFPAVYFAKTQASQSAHAPFSWLGPWRGEFFLGETDDASQPDGARIAGMQFAFQPLRGLEVELVRVVQFGGSGQPNGLSALFGDTNEGARASANQIAGIGLSYAAPDQRSRVYTQVVGEDEAGGLPSCLMYLAGVEFQGQVFDAATTVTLETVDTRINETRGGNCGANTAYNNRIYPYVNKGVDLGAFIGSESRSVDLRVSHAFPTWTLDWSAGYYEINDASDPNHRLSSRRVSGAMLSIGTQIDIEGGTLSGKLVHQGFDLDQLELGRGLRLGLGFSTSF